MQIILMVSSSNEYCNGDCEFAHLDLTPELAVLPRLAGWGQTIGWDRDMRECGVYWQPTAVRIVPLVVGTPDQGF